MVSCGQKKLAHHLVKEQEECLSWIEEEKGEFWQDFFHPAHIPMVPHTPWVYKNIPIPPGLYDELVKIICDKITSGAYEPSNATYHSRWFCIIKWDGSSLHVIHDLRLFNTVTIGDRCLCPTDHGTVSRIIWSLYLLHQPQPIHHL
jgi:hypothetical protein